MSIEQQRTFVGQEASLTVFNGQAIIDLPFEFVYDDTSETAFDFPAISNTYLLIADERNGRTLKTFSQTTGLTRSTKYLVLNASESGMTFDDNGKYYYEMGYVRTGGYEVVLRYGELFVI